jgi:hypothetical protein
MILAFPPLRYPDLLAATIPAFHKKEKLFVLELLAY